MHLAHARTLAAASLCTAMSAAGETLFEDIHAVPLPRRTHGYRGINGNFLQRTDGSLLYTYTDSDQGIVARESRDKGRTWGEQFSILPGPRPPAKGRYVHPSFFRLDNGDIMLTYIYSTHPTTPYHGHNYYRRSADEGKTWTDQFVMTPYLGYVIMHNDRLFTLSTGRIVGLAEYKAHWPSSRDHSGYVGLAFFSDDGGYSWQASKNTVDMQPIEVQEAGGVELKDGRVMMFARTYSGYPVRAYSSDGCETWSKGEPISELKMPYAGLPTVKRIPRTGDLLFIWVDEKSVDKEDPKVSRRCALATAISRDEGQTFTHFRHIARDPEDDFGYQCVEFLKGDDVVLVGYHARDGLHVARIGTDWFYER